jgi:hypothetical protein
MEQETEETEEPEQETEEQRQLYAQEEAFYSELQGRPERIVFCVDLCHEMNVVVGQVRPPLVGQHGN